MKISKTQKPAKLLRVLKEKKKKEQRPAGFEPTTFPFLNDSSTTEQQPTPRDQMGTGTLFMAGTHLQFRRTPFLQFKQLNSNH